MLRLFGSIKRISNSRLLTSLAEDPSENNIYTTHTVVLRSELRSDKDYFDAILCKTVPYFMSKTRAKSDHLRLWKNIHKN